MAAVLINVIVPIDHGLKLTFDAFDDAVGEELIVIREQGGCLFGLHGECPTKRIQNKLKRALSFTRILANIHRHDINTVLHRPLLRCLQSSPPLHPSIQVRHILLHARPRILLPIISAIILEVKDIGIARYPLYVFFDTHEEGADLLIISRNIQALHIILNYNADFLQNIMELGGVKQNKNTYIKLRAEQVPVIKACLRCHLVLELGGEGVLNRKVLVQLRHYVFKDKEVIRKYRSIKQLLRIQLVQHNNFALVDGLDGWRRLDDRGLEQSVEQVEVELAGFDYSARAFGATDTLIMHTRFCTIRAPIIVRPIVSWQLITHFIFKLK